MSKVLGFSGEFIDSERFFYLICVMGVPFCPVILWILDFWVMILRCIEGYSLMMIIKRIDLLGKKVHGLTLVFV